MKDNKFLEYNAQLDFAEIAIKNIKSMGVDTTAFQSKFEMIRNSANDKAIELKNNFSISASDKTNMINEIYSNSVNELASFVEELSEYSLYFQVINKCLYIFNSQENTNYEISKLVDEIIDALGTIRTLNTVDDGNVIKSLYNVVYSAIKAEFRKYGKSKLFDYCKKDENDSVFLSNRILKDIEELRNNNVNMETIDKQMYKLNYSNSKSVYLDEKMVWLIAISENKEAYIKELVNSITKFKNDLKENNGKIYSLIDEKSFFINEINEKESKLKTTRKSNSRAIARSLVPLVVTVATIGVLGGASNLFFGGTAYMTNSEEYISGEGIKPDTKKYESILLNYNGEKVGELTTLTIYEPWTKLEGDDYFTKITRVAEIPSEDFEELSQLSDIDPKESGYRFYESHQITSSVSGQDEEEKYFTVIRKDQDIMDSKSKISSKNEELTSPIILSYVMSVALYLSVIAITSIESRTFGLYKSIREIVDAVKHLYNTSDDKAKLKSLLEKVKEVDRKINEVISQNSDISVKYNELISKAENKEVVKDYQIGLAIIDSYLRELEESKKLSLTINKA